MNNFNPINFFNRFNTQTTSNLNRTQNTQNVDASSQNAVKPSIPNPVLNVQNNGSMPFFMFEQNNLMNNFEKLLLLRELLALPKDLQEFLNTEMTKESAKLLNTLNKEGAFKNITPKEIMALLNEKSPEALKKLSNMVLEYGKIQDTSTQKDLRQLIGFLASVNNQNQDANQTIKNFLLFYLPYLPLNSEGGKDNLNFELEFLENKEENSQSATVIVNTINYGTVKGILEIKGTSDMLVLIQAEENFPSSMLEKLFFEKTKSMNINPQIIQEKTKIQKQKNDKQNVQINSGSSINSYLLFAIYSLIRLIIEIDNSNLSSN